MDANTRIVQGLGKVVDDHIAWLSQWHQAAFYSGTERTARANELKVPTSFLQWQECAHSAMTAQQPVLDRISHLHDQLHTAAKLVLLRAPENEALPIADYEKVLTRFDEFVTAVRRLEHAFSEAAAGLDPLTGLRTRAGLQEDFNREVNRFKNAGTPFVMALADIDHFKNINDIHVDPERTGYGGRPAGVGTVARGDQPAGSQGTRWQYPTHHHVVRLYGRERRQNAGSVDQRGRSGLVPREKRRP
ncbi:MAG: diguanylate cyclase [Proteobacteria bacterium]|nr:diguanylate cyclase [Pseudomonadota bacterium]